MDKESKIYIAGHRGLVGSAIVRNLLANGFKNLLLRTHEELDLCDQNATNDFFERERPEYVFLSAAKVGGIQANDVYRADFIHQNLAIQVNVIHASYKCGVKRLLFLGSSCIYPKECPQPIKEEYLLSGFLETTNEPYAIAKIAGLKMCESYNRQYGTEFICAMPTNLYGPGDNYDPETSHVLAALIGKFVEAKEKGESFVTVWGTGNPRREFLHVDDAANACVFLMNMDYAKWWEMGLSHVNVGTGFDVTIDELADIIKKSVGYEGDIHHDHSKPDGTLRKLLDVSRLNDLGWKYKVDLMDGIKNVVHEYLSR